MKNFIKIFTAIAFFISLINCGGASETGNSSNTRIQTANATNKAVAGTSANVVSNTNTNFIPHPVLANAGENSNVASSGEMKVVKIDPKNLKPVNPATPAPDNSEISSVLNDKGTIETRTFKNNPTLAKIERTSVAGRDVKLKVFLKNGKSVEIPANKIGNFANAPAEQILRAAGIEPPKSSPAAVVQETGAKTTGAKSGMKSDSSDSVTKKP